jgi:hypothetical protein
VGHHQKTKSKIQRHRRRRRDKRKGMDTLSKNIIAENVSNLEKERDNQLQKTFRTTNRQD